MLKVEIGGHSWKFKTIFAAPLLLLMSGYVFGGDPDPVLRVGNGVTPPKVLHKVDPTYSKEAEREMVQGTALYRIVVDKSGRPRDIELLSPIGYGLDERGTEAIRKWVFAPGMKDGMPVSILAQIEVTFRFPGQPFDSKTEERRTSYNAAIHNLQVPDRKAKAVESIRTLAAQKYPPAMSLLGEWMVEGREVPKDVPNGIDLIDKAVDRYDNNALFVLGKLYENGSGVTLDRDKGLKLIREASTYGSARAQFYLGLKYESGDETGGPDPERARYYFRLCAARGTALCQFHLGKLLIPGPGEVKGDPVQAAAWLELARDGSVSDAEALAQSLRERMSAEETRMVEKLKPQLLRR